MFKKFNTRTLLIVFVILLLAVVLKSLFEDKKGDRSFSSELVDLDTSKVKSITITPRNNFENSTKFEKVDGSWVVIKNNKEYKADQASVKEVVNTLIGIKAKRLTATKKEQWKEYEVTDSLATRIIVESKKGVLADILIGKLNYQQPSNPQSMMYGQRQQPIITTFVRNYDETKTYEAEGFLGMTFNRDINSYRNKTVINSESYNWKRLTFNYPADSSFTLTNQNNNWMIDGMAADSLKVVQYINKIKVQTSPNFVEDLIPDSNNPLLSLRIEGDNMQAIEIKAFEADTINKYLVSSSQNEGVFFSGSKANLTKNIFVSKEGLLP